MEHVFAIDCHRHVTNPFVLVHLAARRARQLRRGDLPRIAVRTTHPTLMAIEEIAGGVVQVDELLAPLQISSPGDDLPDTVPSGELELLAAAKPLQADVAPYAGKENREW